MQAVFQTGERFTPRFVNVGSDFTSTYSGDTATDTTFSSTSANIDTTYASSESLFNSIFETGGEGIAIIQVNGVTLPVTNRTVNITSIPISILTNTAGDIIVLNCGTSQGV